MDLFGHIFYFLTHYLHEFFLLRLWIVVPEGIFLLLLLVISLPTHRVVYRKLFYRVDSLILYPDERRVRDMTLTEEIARAVVEAGGSGLLGGGGVGSAVKLLWYSVDLVVH